MTVARRVHEVSGQPAVTFEVIAGSSQPKMGESISAKQRTRTDDDELAAGRFCVEL